MKRDNVGKARLGLIAPSFYGALAEIDQPIIDARHMLEATAKVLEFGAAKYAEYNWLKGGSWMKVVDSALRHLLADEPNDPESGLPHLAHFSCNLMFLIEFDSNPKFKQWDDRPPVGKINYEHLLGSDTDKTILIEFLRWVSCAGDLTDVLHTMIFWFEEYHNADA